MRFHNALAWHTLEVARGLQHAGHQVLLFCQHGSPLADWTRAAGIAANSDFNLNATHPRDMIGGLAALRRSLREFRPDILNPHCPPGHSYLALAQQLENLRIPLVRTVADPRVPHRNPVNSWLHRRHTDGFIFTSRSSLRRYAAVLSGAAPQQAVILPGFRADDFVAGATDAHWREQLGVRADQLLLGVIARMAPEKGQEVLLEALSLLPATERAQILCVIAGDDSPRRGRAELAALARRFGVEQQVAFPGKLADVRTLMRELDVAVITSLRSEAVCRVALEYMSFGVPVITSDVNILPEVVRDRVNGAVFTNGNAQALADLLRAALRDPVTRREWGEAGRALVYSEFSLAREIQCTTAFYSQFGDAR